MSISTTFAVWFTNFHYEKGRYETLEEAIEVACGTGFECVIWKVEADEVAEFAQKRVASFSPISGVRRF